MFQVQITSAPDESLEPRYSCLNCVFQRTQRSRDAREMHGHLLEHANAGHTLPNGLLERLDDEVRAGYVVWVPRRQP
jgi:hypothetical protein